jgi:hypothetical protein
LYADWTVAELREELLANTITDALLEKAWQAAASFAAGEQNGHGWFALASDPITNGGALWLEQLVAETTGKEDRGFVPVLEGASSQYQLRDMMHWHLVAALLAEHVKVDPFNQPNVESAKKNVFALLEGSISWDAPSVDAGVLREALHASTYNVMQVYAPLDTSSELATLRSRVAQTYGTTTANLGPRYLHSTGQLHKGGPEGVVGLQIVQRPRSAATQVPGRSYTFHDLHMAQAQGDLAAMQSSHRTVFQLVVDDFDEAASILEV